MVAESNKQRLTIERFIFCIVIFFLITLVIYEEEQPAETVFFSEEIPSHSNLPSHLEPQPFNSSLIPVADQHEEEENFDHYQYEVKEIATNTGCKDSKEKNLGIQYLAETCMIAVLRDAKCNHRHFLHAGKNCKCLTNEIDCISEKNQKNQTGVTLYSIIHANTSKLDHAITRIDLGGDSDMFFRRFRPGENTSLSIIQYKRPWTPYKVHADSYPFCHVSLKHKVVYMKSPKAGSSLFSWFMSDALGSMFAHCIYDWNDPKRRMYMDASLDNHNGSKYYLDDFLFLASVREPLSRFISGFKEATRRAKKCGGKGCTHPLEKADFHQYKNLSHFIDGVYHEDYSNVYDTHLRSQIGFFLLYRHRMTYTLRLEHAKDDWDAFRSLYPEREMPPMTEKYLGKSINGKNLAFKAMHEMTDEDIRKACWLLRREYCAMSYPLPLQCTDLFACVEIQAGEHNVFMPEPDVQERFGDMMELLVYPQDLLQIHINEQRGGKKGS